MKQKLTLLLIALVTSMGAWAGNATTDAYPVEGKTYYLYAIQNDGSRSYLYNEEGTLKVSNGSKEDANKFKWSVSISDGKYTVSNKAGKVLGWSDSSWALVLSDTGNAFDLSKTVSDGACVSIYTDYLEYTLWWVSPKTSGTYPNNYYISSHTTNNSWSANYVFEEVLSAHSLTNGKFYTIYCDNDSKQYLYDNSGTLAVGTASADFNYVWKCIVNGDYYNLQNVQTGLYLGWKAMSKTPYNFTIGTGDPASRGFQAKSTGMATIYGPNANATDDGRFMIMNYAGGFDQSKETYEKGNTNLSADFRFDEIDMSDYQICLGNNLGGTLGTPGGWGSTWTSGTSLAITMTSNKNNINKTDNNTNGLDIRSGQALEATYTFTVPAGYVIASIELSGYAIKANNDQTITTEDGNTTVFTTSGNRMVYKPYAPSVQLKLTGANEGLFVRSLIFKLESKTFISDLATLSNSKAYIISNQRGSWQCADDASEISASNSRSSFDNDEVKFAIIKKDAAYYLFNVNAGKYLKADQKFTSAPTDAEQVTIAATGNSTYPWIFKFDNTHYFNTTGTNVLINNYSTLDEGNRNAIIDAGDFDATDALAMFETAEITYNLNYGGNSTFKTSEVTVRRSGDASDFLPSEWDKDFVTYSYDPETIGSSTTVVNVTATWNGPFDISSDFASAEWYVLRMRQGGYNVKYDTNGEATYYPLEAAASLTENNVYAWAFVGDPFDGFEIINKEAGSSKTLYAGASPANGGYPLMSSENTSKWIVNGNPKNAEANAFGLQPAGAAVFINDYSANRRLSYWQDNASKDDGSTLTVQKVYPALVELNISPYFNTLGQYFSLATNATNIEKANNVYAPALTNCTKSTYDDLLSFVSNTANMRYPESGCYRIKNVSSSNYIGYGTAGYSGKGDGLIEVSASDYSSVLYLDKQSTDVYKISTQGLNAQTQNTRNAVVPATSSTGADYRFTIKFPGVVSIRANSEDDKGYLFRSSWGSSPESIITWDNSDNKAWWTLETVTDVTISMSGAIEGKSYATFSAPFPVTIGDDAKAYIIETLDLENSRAIYSEIESKQIPAGAGILLISETAASSVTATISGTDFDELSGNILVGYNLAPTFSYPDETTNWNLVLGNSATTGIGFYKMSGTASPNKAYLPYPHTAGTPVKGFSLICADDIIDGISSVEDGQLSEDAVIYNLSGQRLNKMQKGINIINGNKVLVK